LNRPIDMDRHPFFVFGKRISLISFGGRGVLVRNPLNSAAFARYCCQWTFDASFLRQAGAQSSPPYRHRGLHLSLDDQFRWGRSGQLARSAV
jgi:hypothetical protein